MSVVQDVEIKKFVLGPLENNTYLILHKQNTSSECLIIDPSLECKELVEFMKKKKVVSGSVLLTHGHFDHIMGVEELRETFQDIEVWAHVLELPMLSNASVNASTMIGKPFTLKERVNCYTEGENSIAGFSMEVRHIPGHSPGGCALILGENCFSGDSLFAGSIGRVDLPGCDPNALIPAIREKLLILPDETVVWPGHGGRTTIGREKRLNPYLQ